METLIFFISLIVAVAFGFWYKAWVASINSRWNPNATLPTIKGGEKPGCLTSVNLIGCMFTGYFRPYTINGKNTFVTYWTISLLFPILPLIAYRVSEPQKNSYEVYGTEVGSMEERLCLLVRSLSFAAGIFALVMFFAMISSWF